MKIYQKNYMIGAGFLILIIALIATVIALINCSQNDRPTINSPTNPTTRPPVTDPDDEVSLPFTTALVVKVNDSALWARDIGGDSSMFVIKNWTTPFHAFDFYQKKTIFFGNTVAGKAVTSYSKRFSQLMQPGNWYVNQIVVDNVHENVYVLDGLAAKINVFDIRSSYYNIISIDLNQPKDIAIDPVQKYLFILQLSSILRTNLDGASPKVVLEKTGVSAFAVDCGETRIYWATANAIQSIDYTGENLMTVRKIINNVISLAFLKNNLFWLSLQRDHEKPTLWFCKVENGLCKTVSSSIFDDNAVELKAYNFDKLQVSDPCKSKTHCEHMCVNSHNEPKCVCNIGYQLKSDSRNCEQIDEFLLYMRGNFIEGRMLNFTKDDFAAAFLPFQLNIPMTKTQTLSFDFDTRHRELFFSDDESISKSNFQWDSQRILIDDTAYEWKNIKPAIDWISRNVYFVHINEGFEYIAVRNIEPHDLYENHKELFWIDYKPLSTRALVVHPNRGFLFVTLGDFFGEEGQILRANLDGTDRIILGKNLSVSYLKNGLAIDYQEDRLFWFHESLKNVHSADLEGSNLQTIDVSIVHDPIMMNIFGDFIFISNLTSIWRLDKKTGRNSLEIPLGSGYEYQPIRGAKVFSSKSQMVENNHPCAENNGDCERYCFAKPSENAKLLKTRELVRVCECNPSEKLAANGKNCISL